MITEGLTIGSYEPRKTRSIEVIFALSGFFLVSGVVVFSLLLTKTPGKFLLHADPPKNIKITNVTNTSFTVSWETDEATDGHVLYGTAAEKLNLKAFDNNLTGADPKLLKTKNHTVTLTNLSPNTFYYYEIVSKDKAYSEVDGTTLEPMKTKSVSPFSSTTYNYNEKPSK